MRRLFSLCPLLAAAFLASCRPDNSVKVAVVMPLTGDMGAEGQGLYRAIQLAFEQANAEHRLPFRVEAVKFDDRGDPKEAVNVANEIAANPRIVAVIGHYNSGCAIPSAKVYARVPMALVTPAATNPEVTGQQLKPGWIGPQVVFRICPTDDVQGGFAAKYVLSKLGIKRLCLIHDKTAYGQGLAGEFKKAFVAGGGKILSEDGVTVGDKDFMALLTRLRALKPEGVYFGGLYPEAGLIVRQMHELSFGATFLSGDGVRTPGFFDVAGAAADGAYVTMGGMPVEKLPAAKNFLDAYAKRWPGRGQTIRPYDHYGYEAAGVVLDALNRTPATNSGPPSRLQLLATLRDIRHQGILGLTQFDAKGDTLNRAVVMTRARFSDKDFPIVE